LDIISSNQDMRDYHDWSCRILEEICKQEEVKCVIHYHYASSESTDYRDLGKKGHEKSDW